MSFGAGGHIHSFLGDGDIYTPCRCGAVIGRDGYATEPALYGCVVIWKGGSQEWKSGTLPGLAAWLAGRDFTEATIQPIPAATVARMTGGAA